MNPFKFFKKKSNNFLKSIDTITTKLLTLVLFVITIPLMVVGNFSTDIINQSNNINISDQLNLNRKIFEQKYRNEGENIKILSRNIIEQIIDNKNSKDKILKNAIKNNNLDFCALISENNIIAAYAGGLSDKNTLSSFSKIINMSKSGEMILSTESTDNDIYKIIATPVYSKNRQSGSVLLLGKSLKKIYIPQEIKDITDATAIIYKTKNDKALIINSNNAVFMNSSELLKNNFIEILKSQSASAQNAIIPLTNYFNEEIGNVYIGISRNELAPADRNIKSIAIIAVISLLVAMSIAGWFARTITNPILKLVEAAESIALGDLEHQVKIKGNDETAQLAKTFNQMSSNLKKQEQLRDNFVATLTHDLKVPMLAENQTVSYLLKGAYGDISEEQKDVLELIKSTNNSSLEMIGTLLEVYRYDSGNVKLFESEFDMIELLNDSISQIKSLADDKKIQISVTSNRDVILVKADKREIKRVMHNLISNSINNGIHRGFINCNVELVEEKRTYSPKSNTDTYTTLTRTIDLVNTVVLTIEDNGIGLAREDMPLLFQRFSLSKGRKPAGAGLGLYYSYQVIVQHNGNIWAESTDKGGSVFNFTLPVV